MIHYHGTPVGGSRIDASRFLTGRHAFISFFRPDDAPIAMDVCQSFALDNGAFSYWKAGNGAINVAEYHSWVQGFYAHPGIDWCLIPDLIDGTENDNYELVTTWLRIGSRVEGVPVWHLHESLDWLLWLAENFRTIAFGSSGQYSRPGSGGWFQRMNKAMKTITDEQGRPRARLHGLRMLDPEIFRQFPFASADSTNAAVNGGSISRFGMYPPPTASQRSDVIACRIERYNSAPCYLPGAEQGCLF